ncbi:MAG: MTH895/ArsE family thioredoxin-like protein [Armatimonadota bacterium]|nr:MTH895/ArsE family thioredoxin-like protein [Armatimonadota bacterium]
MTEAAEALQLSVPTIKRYIYDGKLKSAKLPGGQHRIPRSEIDRLLTPTGEEQAEALSEEATPGIEERLAVIERWLSDLQAEVERLDSTAQVVASFCERVPGAFAERAAPEGGGHRLYILGTGCPKCNRLYELTTEALDELGVADATVEHIKEPAEIATYGPVLTPALVLDDTVLISGRVPSPGALREMLQEHLESA